MKSLSSTTPWPRQRYILESKQILVSHRFVLTNLWKGKVEEVARVPIVAGVGRVGFSTSHLATREAAPSGRGAVGGFGVLNTTRNASIEKKWFPRECLRT